ncbi:MAG: serine/threonine-protein kinase [Isosphaeraceae bacterium]
MIGSTLNQRFRIDAELGKGGMGAVYEATDLLLGRVVAIKVLKELGGEEAGRKIRLEAQILARLLHDSIVRLYDFGLSDGLYYLVMEKVDGPSFHHRWKRIDLALRLQILAQVADALDYAHRQGIIHRDVKPANILLTSVDQAKLSDFGLSLLAEEAAETGNTKGTPHYMSPEQARGKKLDHRTDLYALGVILYECACGSPPFSGVPMAVMSQQVHGQPDPPRSRNPSLSESLELLILTMMAKAPDDRPASGAVVANALRDLVAQGGHLRAESPQFSATALLPAGTPADPDAARVTVDSPAPPTRTTARGIVAAKPGGELARRLLDRVLVGPVELTPSDRYLCGHYLAYLLGGSRRKGFLLRRPLDPLNADRARLLLGMTAMVRAGATEAAIAESAELIEGRFDVRPLLSPMVIVKYLACRSNPARRKLFRQARQRLLEASPYAQRALVDGRGVLNPGLMPQAIADLQRVAPARDEVDDQLVARWNRVTELWREDATFRNVVLRYATTRAAEEPASIDLWPEVVYPLIERAHWQRRLRSGGEAFWDAVSKNLGLPDPGIRLDRAIRRKVAEQDIRELDASLGSFEEDPVLPGDAAVIVEDEAAPRPSPGVSGTLTINPRSFEDIRAEPEDDYKEVIRLVSPDPVRLNHGELRELNREAVQALHNRTAGAGVRGVAVGPYRLVVVASVRGRSAGTLAVQGMKNHKQIELMVPPFIGATSASRPIVALWPYRNQSLAISYLDFQGSERFVLWDAASAQQTNFDSAAAAQQGRLPARPGSPRPDRPGPDQAVPAQESGLRRLAVELRESGESLAPKGRP